MGRIEEILEFWFGSGEPSDPGRQRMWFSADPAFDETCKKGFAVDYERAARGELDDWMKRPDGALALILLLDQFSRNMFRGTARAFATDEKARAAARHAVQAGQDRALPASKRGFVYMPFQHSENLGDQHESVRLFEQLARENPQASGFPDYARRHLDVISRFGRFPHRNAVLGRVNTPEESEFLAKGDSSF